MNIWNVTIVLHASYRYRWCARFINSLYGKARGGTKSLITWLLMHVHHGRDPTLLLCWSLKTGDPQGFASLSSLVLVTTTPLLGSAEVYYGKSMRIKVTTQHFCLCTWRFRTSSGVIRQRIASGLYANYNKCLLLHGTNEYLGEHGTSPFPK